MQDGLVSFVAHVREAKCLATNRAVAWIDDEMMFLPQLLRHRQNVDAFIVFHAGEGLGAETVLSEEIEARPADPIVNERVGAGVPGEPRFEAFLKNFAELRLQGVDVADARSALRHPFGLLLLELDEVEVVATVRNFFGALKCFFGHSEEGKAGRKSERFLRAGQHDVDAQCVHVDPDTGEGGNGVDDQGDVGVLRERATNLRQRIHHAG